METCCKNSAATFKEKEFSNVRKWIMEATLKTIDFKLISSVVNSVQQDRWYIELKEIHSSNNFSAIIYDETTQISLNVSVLSIFYSNDHIGAKDEKCIIQISGLNQLVQRVCKKTIILCWSNEFKVFAGFDYSKHPGWLGDSPSIQIGIEHFLKASIDGFSPCDIGNGEIVIIFKPDFLITYIQNLEQLHGFGTSRKDFKVLEEISEQPLEVNAQLIQQVSKQRQAAIFQMSKKLLNTSFNSRVLNAYGNKCAFSGQYLKYLDAVHIIPVNHESSSDNTTNGIALSALYYRAYDMGLITFNEKYQTIVNESKMSKLNEIGFDGNIDELLKNLRPMIILPIDVNYRPNINFVKEANILRGWK